MTDEERSEEGYKLYLAIRAKLDAGATIKHESSGEFFLDMTPQFKANGYRTAVSPRRLKWLRDIFKSQLTKVRKAK